MAPNKRQHKTLTLKEKCKVLNCLDQGFSIRNVADKFNIARSTVYDIKNNKLKIRHFVSTSFHGVGMTSNRLINIFSVILTFLYFSKKEGYKKSGKS